MPRFTDKFIAALKPETARYEKWEEGRHGFGVRVTPNGVKSFVQLYRLGAGPSRRLTLGRYPTMGLADAHLAADAALKTVERGDDPGKAAVAEREAERKAETVDQLITDYLERHAKPNKKSWRGDERILNNEILPRWRGRKVKDITRRDVVALLDRIIDRGSPVAANRTLACVRRMFNFAVERGVIEQSPCYLVKRPHKERPRERVLTSDEIRRAWQALDTAAMELNVRRALKLLIATGQRRAEVVGLHEREIDRQAALWTIPASRSKNSREHIVPLSPLALQIIGDPPKAREGADPEERKRAGWTFPSGRTGEPYDGKTLDHAVRDLFIPRLRQKGRKHKTPLPPLANQELLDRRQALEAQGKREGDREWQEIARRIDAERWTPHDLRRTGATMMRELGISRDDVGLVLNHTDPGVTGRHYDKYRGLEEKRRALLLWGQRLEQIIAGEPAIDPSSGAQDAPATAAASNVVSLLVTARG